MANTPGGLPYPLPTDPVTQGADAIHALALALDPTVIRGKRSIGAFGGQTLANMASGVLVRFTYAWNAANAHTVSDFGGAEFATPGQYTCPADGFYAVSGMFNSSAQMAGRNIIQITTNAPAGTPGTLASSDLFTAGVARNTASAVGIWLPKNCLIYWDAMQSSGAVQNPAVSAAVRYLHE